MMDRSRLLIIISINCINIKEEEHGEGRQDGDAQGHLVVEEGDDVHDEHG